MRAIHELLNETEDERDIAIQKIFFSWAMGFSIHNRHFQNIIANAAISQWWRREMTKLERDFLNRVRRYDDSNSMTKVDYKECYARSIEQIFEIYPGALIDACKPNEKVYGKPITIRDKDLDLDLISPLYLN